jgi:hypothetical protein
MLSCKKRNHQIDDSLGLQNPINFPQAGIGLPNMFQHVHAEGSIKGLIRKRKRLQIRQGIKPAVLESFAHRGIDSYIISAFKERTISRIARSRIQDKVA